MYSSVYPGIWKGLYVERCNWQERHCSVIHHLHCTFFYILESSALWALPRVPCTMYILYVYSATATVHCIEIVSWALSLQLTQCFKCDVYHCSPAITYLILYALQLVPKSCAVLCLPWNLQMWARLPIYPLYVERCHCNERQSSTVHCLVSYIRCFCSMHYLHLNTWWYTYYTAHCIEVHYTMLNIL